MAAAGGLTGDDEEGPQETGQLMYQESKVFSGEVNLCNVFVHEKRAVVTFEVYGLDSQDTLQIAYPMAEFDALFRFNAELMNPNRKEGRYHWVIARMEIVIVGKDSKLQLGAKPTEEVPQVPMYETQRKIPTGRMDLKERQRLREQMDMLEIRRAENISKKRQANKERFLQKIFLMKDADAKKKAQVQEKIEREQADRFEMKAQRELEEAEEFRQLMERQQLRQQSVEVKEQRTEEQDEEEYRQLRQRWRDKDAQELQAYKDKKAARKAELANRAKAKKDLENKQLQIQMKRESVWRARETRIAQKDEQTMDALRERTELRRREKEKLQDRNMEYVKMQIAERQLEFEKQMQRMKDREAAFDAEEAKIADYHEERSLPKRVKNKGRFSPAEIARKEALEKEALRGTGGSAANAAAAQRVSGTPQVDPEAAEGGDEAAAAEVDVRPPSVEPTSVEPVAEEPVEKKKSKKGKDKAPAPVDEGARNILDEVDLKMRADLEKQERQAMLQKQRVRKIEEMRIAREEKENQRMKEYRAEIRAKELAEATREAEARVIMTQKEQEKKDALERQRQDRERLQRLRDSNVAAKEARRLERLQAAR